MEPCHQQGRGMGRPMNDAKPLALCILATLRSSPKPLKRRELADLCGPHGMKISSAERRIREALDHLVMVLHIPVMNEGAGYFIARNPEQFEKGLRILEKTVNAESQRIKTLRRMKSGMQYPAQSQAQSLPFEVVA